MYDSRCRYGGFSLGARQSQFMSHADEMDEAIAELRQRFRLERVRDCCISVHPCCIKKKTIHVPPKLHPRKQPVCYKSLSLTPSLFCLSRELQLIDSSAVSLILSKEWIPRISSRCVSTSNAQTHHLRNSKCLSLWKKNQGWKHWKINNKERNRNVQDDWKE